jgi:intein/homing endonuclease
MPSTEKTVKSELTGTIDTFLRHRRSQMVANNGPSQPQFLSIIDFINRFKLLPNGLFPVQEFILKLYYNMPLDDVLPEDPNDRIRITDRFGVNVLHELTEVEYLQFLYSQGRCNIKAQDGQERRELLLCLGRRSGKSALAAIIAAYELYKLLCRGYPQDYYGIPPNNEIRILCVANDKEQASIVYSEMSGHVEAVDYFKSAQTSHTQTFMRFQTDNDKKIYGDGGKATLTATFKSSVAKGLRGRGIMCAILDELAFFIDDGKCLERLFSNILTDQGVKTLEDIIIENNIDGSKIGWNDIKPIQIVQESGRAALATRIYCGGIQKTRKIETKSRYSIRPTLEHRLKIMSSEGNIEWKYVRDIQIGDFIGINRKTKLWPVNEYECVHLIPEHKSDGRFACLIPGKVDSSLGEFLGILVGDGTWSSGKNLSTIMVTGGCEQFLPFVQSHFSRYFPVYGTGRKPSHKHNTCEVSPWNVSKHSFSFRTFLDHLGYRLNATKSTKSVPWVIFRSPKDVVAAFLRGLFETDGGLEQNGRTVSFCSASKQLTSEVQLLLLNFGITASIYHKYNKKYDRYYYTLRIIGYESRRIFRDEIGFITARKNKDLDHGVDFGRDASNTIPNQQSRVHRILESIPKSDNCTIKGTDARTRMTRACGSILNKKICSDISCDSVQNVIVLGRELGADAQALNELDDIYTANYFWDPVVSIEESEGEVADLFVPDGHEYVVQGMTSHNSSSERVYKALVPSIAQFSPKDPKNKRVPVGPSEGRIISISSPDARAGFFYRLYQIAMSNSDASKNMLMIQAPTWEVNTALHRSYYEVEYHKDPKSFATEHGAEFSDRVRGWIEDAKDLTDCIKSELRPSVMGVPRDPHWAGVDFGIKGDGTAIALNHIKDGKVELVYHEVWYPRKKWSESNPHLTTPLVPYALQLQDMSRLDLDEIGNWFKALSLRFFIIKGVFDQYAGHVFEQALHKKDLTQFEMKYFSPAESSQVYTNTKMMMYSQQIVLYDYPLPEVVSTSMDTRLHSPLIQEMLELQATSGGKNIVVVEAPQISGKHDDMSDAYARSVWLASEYIREHPGVMDVNIAAGPSMDRFPTYGLQQYRRIKARLHGGTPRERSIPASFRHR